MQHMYLRSPLRQQGIDLSSDSWSLHLPMQYVKILQAFVIMNNFWSIIFLSVRQVDRLSPFLFSLSINDVEDELIIKGMGAISNEDFKMSSLLYADACALLSETRSDFLQEGIILSLMNKNIMS